MIKHRLTYRCLILAIAFFMFGCATNLDKYNASGGLLYTHFSSHDYGSIVSRANVYCSTKGFNGPPQISKFSDGCLLGCPSEYHKYQFTCSSRPDLRQASPALEPEARMPMSEAKSKCKKLGFEAGSQRFGECVLKLTE
jgi:hypothetical protein